MKKIRIEIWNDKEYNYQGQYNFKPSIMAYINEDEVRPAILILPGGGYEFVSPSEAENVALKFYELGYNTFVLTYTVNILKETLLFQPLKDAARALSYLRYYSNDFHIISDQIYILGFSAGGHLAGSLAVHYNQDFIKDSLYNNTSAKPNAAILSYPVISGINYSHKGSFINLLGESPSLELLELMSLEKQVTKDTPPVFLWHTITDDIVPYENSLMFVEALKEHNIKHELLLFDHGGHGLSLADEFWAKGIHKAFYVEEQLTMTIDYLILNNLKLPKHLSHYEAAKAFDSMLDYHMYLNENFPYVNDAYKKILIWPLKVDQWLKELKDEHL